MFFIFDALNQSWMQALESLVKAIEHKNHDGALEVYRKLFRELSGQGLADLETAVAKVLLEQDSRLSYYAMQKQAIPEGLKQAAHLDLDTVRLLLKRDWSVEVHKLTGHALPPLIHLAPKDPALNEVMTMLKTHDSKLLEYLLASYQKKGTGILSQFSSFGWADGKLQGIKYPVEVEAESLVKLERPLELLQKNTLAFLQRKPAQHTLLYGPRGSGKSTAVRSLLKSYANQGLGLIELMAQDVLALPVISEQLRSSPGRYIIFIDDLSFEQGDTSYHPLKTLLEGSLTQPPNNVLIYATSNRRHLLKEQFSDRPDPLNEDVHAWDTHNERLALSDRFGLTITFPDATQQRYLEIVRGILSYEKLQVENLDERAIRFAEWGNGYSGRTAQQFVDSIKAEED